MRRNGAPHGKEVANFSPYVAMPRGRSIRERNFAQEWTLCQLVTVALPWATERIVDEHRVVSQPKEPPIRAIQELSNRLEIQWILKKLGCRVDDAVVVFQDKDVVDVGSI